MKVIIILLYDALINYHGQPLNESNAKLATHFINSSIISANFFGSRDSEPENALYIQARKDGIISFIEEY